MNADRAPAVGDLLILPGGRRYRVLAVNPGEPPGSVRLDGYEIHCTAHGPVLVPATLRWRDGRLEGDDGS